MMRSPDNSGYYVIGEYERNSFRSERFIVRFFSGMAGLLVTMAVLCFMTGSALAYMPPPEPCEIVPMLYAPPPPPSCPGPPPILPCTPCPPMRCYPRQAVCAPLPPIMMCVCPLPPEPAPYRVCPPCPVPPPPACVPSYSGVVNVGRPIPCFPQ